MSGSFLCESMQEDILSNRIFDGMKCNNNFYTNRLLNRLQNNGKASENTGFPQGGKITIINLAIIMPSY